MYCPLCHNASWLMLAQRRRRRSGHYCLVSCLVLSADNNRFAASSSGDSSKASWQADISELLQFIGIIIDSSLISGKREISAIADINTAKNQSILLQRFCSKHTPLQQVVILLWYYNSRILLCVWVISPNATIHWSHNIIPIIVQGCRFNSNPNSNHVKHKFNRKSSVASLYRTDINISVESKLKIYYRDSPN